MTGWGDDGVINQTAEKSFEKKTKSGKRETLNLKMKMIIMEVSRPPRTVEMNEQWGMCADRCRCALRSRDTKWRRLRSASVSRSSLVPSVASRCDFSSKTNELCTTLHQK